MNQASKSSYAEQRSVNKKYIAREQTGQDKIVTWAMNEYKRFDKKHVCADMSLFFFKIHDPGRFRKCKHILSLQASHSGDSFQKYSQNGL